MKRNASTKRMAALMIALSIILASGLTGCNGSDETMSSTEVTEDVQLATPTASGRAPEVADYMNITLCSQISPEDDAKIQEMATLQLEEQTSSFPDEVTIDACQLYARMVASYRKDPYTIYDCDFTPCFVYVYEVSVTDSMGNQPVSRKFFWSFGFQNYCQYGSIICEQTFEESCYVFFDQWYTAGAMSSDSVIEEWERDYDILDTEYLMGQPEMNGRELVTGIHEVSEQQWAFLKDSAISHVEVLSDFESVLEYSEPCYLGAAYAETNSESNAVYAIYQVDVTVKEGEKTSKRPLFFYVGCQNMYTNECLLNDYLRSDHCVTFDDYYVVSGFYLFVDLQTELRQANETADVFCEEYQTDVVGKVAEGFVFPDSDFCEISVEEIHTLSDEELRMAINEIWARHRYKFRDQELLDYYSQFYWYDPIIVANEWDKHDQSYYLSDMEMKNITAMIEERESR